MRGMAKSFAACRLGATAIEYSLIVALVAIAIVAGVAAVGTSVHAQYNIVATAVP